MKAALDAALRFHDIRDTLESEDAVIDTAKRFYRELAVTPPGAAEDWDEEWFSRVGTWLATLSGDQLGSVRGQLANLERSRQPVMVAVAPPYDPTTGRPVAPVYMPSPVSAPAPGTVVPIPESSRKLFEELGGDPRSLNDVQAAAEAADDWRSKTLAPEPRAVSEALGRKSSETLLAAAERVMSELNELRQSHPIAPPAAVPGSLIRIRPVGADVYTTATVAAKLEYDPAEGFRAFVPPGAFSEAAKDQLEEASAMKLLELLKPAGTSGTIIQQVKQLVGTVQSLRDRIKTLEEAQKNVETELREILGARPEIDNDDWDNPHYEAAETSTVAARRVMNELSIARARIVDLEKR